MGQMLTQTPTLETSRPSLDDLMIFACHLSHYLLFNCTRSMADATTFFDGASSVFWSFSPVTTTLVCSPYLAVTYKNRCI